MGSSTGQRAQQKPDMVFRGVQAGARTAAGRRRTGAAPGGDSEASAGGTPRADAGSASESESGGSGEGGGVRKRKAKRRGALPDTSVVWMDWCVILGDY